MLLQSVYFFMDPNKLTVIHNADKGFHEKWDNKRNLCNFPHPFRAILIGRPGCGKTSTAQNILIRQEPPFERLVVVHVDGEYSQEWDECDPTEVIDYVPNFKDIDGKTKTLIVFEDFEIAGLKRDDQCLLSRLFGYCSTHKNCSLLVCQQDPKAVPALIRRLSNLFVLWRGLDMGVLDGYGTRMGLERGRLKQLFDSYTQNSVYDSIWLDSTPGTPAPVRINCYQVIKDPFDLNKGKGPMIGKDGSSTYDEDSDGPNTKSRKISTIANISTEPGL